MKALGKIEVENQEKTIYVENIDNNRYVYYLGDTAIGGYNKDVSDDKIIFKQNTVENELSGEIKDKVQAVLKEISLEEIQKTKKDYNQEKVNGINQLLGLERGEKISRIAEIDTKEEIKEQKEKAKQKKPSNQKNQQEPIKPKNEKNFNIKQEMNFDDKATDMKTLGHLLEKEGKMPHLDGKKFTKMGVIESYQMNEITNEKGEKSNVNTTRYSFVAIATDGTIVPVDLEQDYQEGNNPRETNYQARQDGRVEQDDVLSRFRIGEGTFAVKNGQYGELKVYHSPRKTLGGEGIEGNKSLDRELETNSVWEMKKEERDLAAEHGDGYRSVEEGYQEAKNIEQNNKKQDCNEMKIADIDGEEQTQGHNHFEEFVQKTADELMEIDMIDEVFTRKEIEESIRRAKETDTQKLTNEQIAQKVKQELEYDAEMLNREK